MGIFVEKCGKEKKLLCFCKLENHSGHELGWIYILLYSSQTDSVPNILLSFRLPFPCCNVPHLFLMVADGWHCRCFFKVQYFFFSIYCGSLRSQAYEGHRSTVLVKSIE